MRGICAISPDKDRTFISFAQVKRTGLHFLKEAEVPATGGNGNIASFLRDNIEIIDKKIREMEVKYSCRCEKIFLELPWGLAKEKKVEDVITFKSRKKIVSGDISRAKKHLEDKFLSWDDFCIHNIVINYDIEGNSRQEPPLGVFTKKIKLRSLLVWVKDKLHKELEDIFDGSGRNLGGIVSPQISRFASVFTAKDKAQAVISVDYDRSRFVARSSDDFFFGKEFNFSFCRTIEELAKRFVLNTPLAEDIFQRYISFKEIPYFKEITIKRDSRYVNLSTQTLNSFVKDYVKREVCCILQEIREDIPEDDLAVSFIGRLNAKEGFYGSLQDFVPYSLKAPLQRSALSSSYGCLRYGISRFLEDDHKNNEPVIRRILKIYREYF